MKIYKTQSEVEKDIKNGVLAIEGDVRFECSISINAKITVSAGDITAWNITAWNITAWNITAEDITAWNITANDITAGDITAFNINAGNITAFNINAGNIIYYAFCCVYTNIECLSIKAIRNPSKEPICLEGELKIKELGTSAEKEAIELLKKQGYKIIKE